MRSAPAGAGHVVVVGSVNVDLVAVVDRLPGGGETVIGGRFERHWGGKGANQAVAAGQFGAVVHFVGAVGDDEFGRAAIEALAAEGIDTDRIEQIVGMSTGVALIVVDAAGENQIAVASGANLAVTADAVPELLASQAPGVLLANFEVPEEAVVRAALAARAAGWKVVINPAPARALPIELQSTGVILTPNEQELEAIAGAGDPETAAGRLVEYTGGPIAVTLGERGALLIESGATTRVPALAVQARDTTGAGDVFNGVLAAVLAEGGPLARAVELAVAAASLSVERPGARAHMERSEVVRRHLAAGPDPS